MSYLGSTPNIGTPFSNNKIQVLSGNGSNTEFTLDYRVNSKADIEVVVNNVQQSPFDGSYDVSNNNILVFGGAPTSGANNIHIYFRGYSHNVSVPEANSITSNQLTTTGVIANTYGNTTAIPVITVDAAGRITSATTNSVSGVTGVSWTTANNTLTVSTSTVAYSANVSEFDNPVTFANTITTKAIVPDANVAYDIGTSAKRFKDIYLANSTIYIGNTTVSESGGSLQISNAGAPAVDLATIDQANTLAATAYSNAASYADTKAAAAFTNASSYTVTMSGTAYSNAVSTAAADATSKSDTAYSNAVSTAATDASTKAATAYSNAIAYAAANSYVNSTFTKLTDTRAVSISNTLATGNTTITGFANVSGSLQVGGVATISGNLVVNGTTITVNTSQINTTDSLMYLASNNEVSDSIDIGMAGHYNNGAGANGHTGFIRSAVTKKWYLFQNYQPEFFANNTVDVSNTATGIQMADLVVGNLVANSTLTVTGAATFSNTTTHTGAATFSNTIAVTGTSTFTGLITGTITSANNADYLDGQHGAYYAANSQLASYALLSGSSALSINNTLAAGNTTITGFANIISGYVTLASNTSYATIGTGTNVTGAKLVTYYQSLANTSYQPNLTIGHQQSAGADHAWTWRTAASSPLILSYSDQVAWTTFTDLLAVTSTGNVGIGNNSPSHKISVNGTGYFGTSIAIGNTSSFTDKRLLIDGASNMHAISALSNTYSYATVEVINTDTAATRYFQVFRTARGSGTIGSITGDTAGTGTTFNTASDYRLKTDVHPINDGKERIMKLQPVRHGWVSNNNVVVDGFLAHQAQESGFEYAVTGTKDGNDMQSMDYGRISPVIVAALQDAFKEIDELRAIIRGKV